MADSPHPYDGVAQDLLDWMDGEVAWYVDALKGGHRSPFAAATTEQEKREFYTRQVFNYKDGQPDFTSPNSSGRDMLLKRLGVGGYAQVMKSVMPKQGIRPEIEPNPESEEGMTGDSNSTGD